MDWKAYLNDMNGVLASYRKAVPDTAAGFGALAKAATAEGALDVKAKELIALSVAVGLRCEPCIGYHAKALVKLGATREEVAEALGVVVYMGGGPGLMYAGKALDAFDQLS